MNLIKKKTESLVLAAQRQDLKSNLQSINEKFKIVCCEDCAAMLL